MQKTPKEHRMMYDEIEEADAENIRNQNDQNEQSENYDPEKDNPEGEDVYDMHLVNEKVDPDDVSRLKQKLDALDVTGDQQLYIRMMGSDLDVPGSELDDASEDQGDEDEENNYYSLDDQDD